jgi:hypothetical protein
MSEHLKSYIAHLDRKSPKASPYVLDTIKEIVPKHIKNFSFREHLTGLLLGNVQSGKTSQILGLAAASADEGFEILILLTTDNVYLHRQTVDRASEYLSTFLVCSEDDEIKFTANAMKKPVLIVIKKNHKILQKWRNNIASSGFCSGRALLIFDDEGDAASLNTKVNQRQQSQINAHLESMKRLANSSIYIEVTATPQALLLQTKISGWKPAFLHYFPPGKDYLGGDFFYSDPMSYAIRLTAENELDGLRSEDGLIAEGLRDSLFSFLLSGAHILLSKQGPVCNFLIHPSVRIADHERVAERIGEYLNEIFAAIAEDQMQRLLKAAWKDLQKTKPDILDFEELNKFIHYCLDNSLVKIFVMNSRSPVDIDCTKGLNIIVGGTSLGRGLTFKGLQTVYYCRKSKVPQADTYWQHCRMFGYDRDPGLMRIYLPPVLLKLFTELNNANRALIAQVQSHDPDDLSLLYPPGIKPTRANVLDKDALNLIVGGVNYFPSFPKQDNPAVLDSELSYYDETRTYKISLDELMALLEKIENEDKAEWSNKAFINSIKALKADRAKNEAALIVRRDRSIGKGTGTLLSPTDRTLGDGITKIPVLTLYRINGEKDKGWDGKPLWIPNIKLPTDKNFYRSG